MGDLIRLAERRAARDARSTHAIAPTRVEFLFDLCCPFSYLAAERVDRIFDHVVWTPASTSALCCGSMATIRRRWPTSKSRPSDVRPSCGSRSIWPERFPEEVPAAMRAASTRPSRPRRAVRARRGAARVLRRLRPRRSRAARRGGRGGGSTWTGWLHASARSAGTAQIEAAGARLLAAGADRCRRGASALPLLGEHCIDEAAAAARHRAARRPAALRADEAPRGAAPISSPGPDRRPGSRQDRIL